MDYSEHQEGKYTVRVYANGSKRWYVNSMLHREDGPAVENSNGRNYWYIKGELHREDGPAVEYADGSKAWYVNGELHREDGPAVENSSKTTGTKYYYVNGKAYSKEVYYSMMWHKLPIEAKLDYVYGL